MVDLKKLDLNLLVVFEAIYVCSSISRAADSLGLSQPAVSNALNRLRGHFDDPLFVREGRGVAPTAVSRRVIAPVRDALAILQSGLAQLDTFDPAVDAEDFVISVPDVVATTRLAALIATVEREAPNVRIELINHSWTEPWEHLLTGRADFSIDIFGDCPPGVTLAPLAEVDQVVIASEQYGPVGVLDAETYASAGHVVLPERAERRLPLREALANAGIERRCVCIAANALELASIVGQTRLLGLMPRPWVETMGERFGLRWYETPFPCAKVWLHCGWMGRREAEPGLQWLRQQVLAVAPRQSGPG